MSTLVSIRRPLAILLAAAVATSSIAPLAEAGRKNRRHRDVVVERRVVHRPVYRSVRVHRRPHASYTVWRSGHGPVIAGFLGGMFLGATLANAAPRGFTYWDPYCHRGFASLELYYSHSHRRHDRRIEVVEVPYGYDRGDVHYCDHCDSEYWGDEHDCE